MKVKEIFKNYQLKNYEIIFKDLYGNEHNKTDLEPEKILKVEELETRNVDINYKTKKAVFYLFGLYELMEEKEK